jgi:hypothetical protein
MGVKYVWRMRNSYRILTGKCEDERDHPEDLSVAGRIILKYISEK